MMAVDEGHNSQEQSAKRLKRLLQSYVDADTYSFEGFTQIEVSSVGKELETPLHMIVTRGDADGVELLIEAGADVNARTDIDSTPLHRAVIGGNLAIIKMLLTAGADPNAVDHFGATAASLAEGRPNREEIRTLLRRRHDGGA